MVVKQLSVFMENREGRMEQVSEVLAKNGINIASLSLADTSEYGMLRMIVSDPEEGRRILKESGFSTMLTDVLAVKLPQGIGMLQKLLNAVYQADLNVEYMYTLATGITDASIIIKVSDAAKALGALEKNGLEAFTAQEAYRLNA